MPNTFVKIASTTVGAGGTSAVTFSSIPQTYTDLVVKASVRSDRSQEASDFNVTFNGSTSSIYTNRAVRGNGSSVTSFGSSGDTSIYATRVNGNTATANVFSNVEIYIPNYTSANYKSTSTDGVTENNGTTAYAEIAAGLWSNTAAITSIGLSSISWNLLQYSTFTLYGIKSS